MFRQKSFLLRVILLSLSLVTVMGAGAVVYAAQLQANTLSDVPSEVPEPTQHDSALEQRLKEERRSGELRFSIIPHKTNYLLPVTYNTAPNNSVYNGLDNGTEKLDNTEVKFQLSIKTPVWEDIFGNNGTLYLAYSQLTLWQAYNTGYSSPFREINFEPEIFLSFLTNFQMWGMTGKAVTVGYNHQSNGRAKPLSRGWNRIVANLLFSINEQTYISLRPWYRMSGTFGDDENFNTNKYYGCGELFILQKFHDHTLTMMLRNNLRATGNKGAVQLDWSFPLHRNLKGYVQYFNGYGESLVDYNHANNRFGLGVMLTDLL